MLIKKRIQDENAHAEELKAIADRKAADAQAALDRQQAGWDSFMQSQDQITLDMRAHGVSFADIVQGMAADSGKSLGEVVADLQNLGVKANDVFSLVEAVGREKIEALIGSLAELKAEIADTADSGGGGGRGGGGGGGGGGDGGLAARRAAGLNRRRDLWTRIRDALIEQLGFEHQNAQLVADHIMSVSQGETREAIAFLLSEYGVTLAQGGIVMPQPGGIPAILGGGWQTGGGGAAGQAAPTHLQNRAARGGPDGHAAGNCWWPGGWGPQ